MKLSYDKVSKAISVGTIAMMSTILVGGIASGEQMRFIHESLVGNTAFGVTLIAAGVAGLVGFVGMLVKPSR